MGVAAAEVAAEVARRGLRPLAREEEVREVREEEALGVEDLPLLGMSAALHLQC